MVEAVFRYCERGTATGVFAEPVNTFSNLAFLAVAIVLWRSRRTARDTAIALGTAAVAAGSMTFHLAAQRWAELADVVPISLLLSVLGWTILVEVLGMSRRASIGALILLAAAMAGAALAMSTSGCDRPLLVSVDGRNVLQPLAAQCLNGGWAYVPAALTLWLAGMGAYRLGCAGCGWVVAAAAAFTAGLVARTLDLDWCPAGARVTFHALWHGAVAIAVYCLVRASKSRETKQA